MNELNNFYTAEQFKKLFKDFLNETDHEFYKFYGDYKMRDEACKFLLEDSEEYIEYKQTHISVETKLSAKRWLSGFLSTFYNGEFKVGSSELSDDWKCNIRIAQYFDTNWKTVRRTIFKDFMFYLEYKKYDL